MDVILKDVSLDSLNYLKSLIVRQQTELMVALRSFKEDDLSRSDLLEQINKLDFFLNVL